jgi:hypothetical protein
MAWAYENSGVCYGNKAWPMIFLYHFKKCGYIMEFTALAMIFLKILRLQMHFSPHSTNELLFDPTTNLQVSDPTQILLHYHDSRSEL